VIDTEKEFGVAASGIRASELSIAPRREYRNSECHHVGYSAELQVDIKFHEIQRFPKLFGNLVDVPVIAASASKPNWKMNRPRSRLLSPKPSKTPKAKQQPLPCSSVFSWVASTP
jgi:hypothetical protein